MYPYIHIINRDIASYGILALIGILAAGFYIVKNLEKKGYKEVNILMCLFSVALGSFIGAHILFFITNFKNFISFIKNITLINSIKKLFIALSTLFGGWVFYGGLIGGIIAILIYCKIHKIKPNDYLNVCAPGVALFHFFGRIGCFLAGCCYGVESHIGFTFHHSAIQSANGISRFPIQLVESSYCLLLFLILNHILKKTRFKDLTASCYLILYPLGRFVFEFFRGDTYRGFLWIFSTSQWISIVLLIIGIINIIKYTKKENK